MGLLFQKNNKRIGRLWWGKELYSAAGKPPRGWGRLPAKQLFQLEPSPPLGGCTIMGSSLLVGDNLLNVFFFVVLCHFPSQTCPSPASPDFSPHSSLRPRLRKALREKKINECKTLAVFAALLILCKKKRDVIFKFRNCVGLLGASLSPPESLLEIRKRISPPILSLLL